MARARRRLWLASSAAAAALAGAPAFAQTVLPTGGSVAAGAARIGAPSGGSLAITQTSPRAVIDWQSFSIGQGGSVVFHQPGAGSAVLNRVAGPLSTSISGSLTGDGQVFLVNRNGVVVGRTGVVSAPTFVASTLDIADDDFMAGRLKFSGDGANGVLNLGQIAAAPGGAVALLGGYVSNQGLISAQLGHVGLGSGQQATLDFSGDGFLQVALPASPAGVQSLIDASGRIEADGGEVILSAATARQAVRQAVNMSGVVQARQVEGRDGAVTLLGGDGGSVGVSGQIDVSGASGGRVDVTGQAVSLTGARIDASGTGAGGLVRIGGAFRGGGAAPGDPDLQRFMGAFASAPALASARTVGFDASSLIDVSGGRTGGTAVLWSEGGTSQAGRILGAGGLSAGAVEMSSHGQLNLNIGQVSLGKGGVLLLDPANITVDAGSDTYTGPINYGSGPDLTLSRAQVTSVLNAGTDVILKASNDIFWGVGLLVTAAHGGNIVVSAGRNATLTGDFFTAGGSITVTANDTAADGVVDADRSAGVASIELGSNFILGGGTLTAQMLNGAGITNASAGRISVGSTSAGAINLLANTPGGSLFITGDQTAGGAVTVAGDIQVSGLIHLSGSSVSWTSQATSALTGEEGAGAIQFIENGVLTHAGFLDGSDAARVSLGSGLAFPQYTKVYGDADPTVADLHVTSGALRAGDTLDNLLAANSISVSLPGTQAHAGDHSLSFQKTGSFAFSGSEKGYFIDLTSVTETLRITPRPITATVSDADYTYGSPSSPVTLTGLLAGDSVGVSASVGGLGAQVLSFNGGNSYTFDPSLPTGSRSYTLTGLTGGSAGDYQLNLGGTITANLTITPKPITYQVFDTTSTYGTAATPNAFLNGVISGDQVSVGSFLASANGSQVTLGATTAAGTYSLSLGSLTGASSGNYTVASTGNVTGTLTISPKALSYTAPSGTSVYGTLAALAPVTLTGVVPGDQVGAFAALQGATLAFNTPAGTYTVIAGALSGAQAGDYTVGSGLTGRLVISPKALGVQVMSPSQVYGSSGPVAQLVGLVAGDAIGLTAQTGSGAVVLTSLGGGEFGFSDHTPVGTLSFNLAGATAGPNYTLSFPGGATGLLTVTPKPITYSVANLTSTYGTLASPGVTLNGVLAGDIVTPQLSVTSGASIVSLSARSPVGSYGLSVSGISGAQAGDYQLSATGDLTGVLTINPRQIGFGIGGTSSTYGTLAVLPAASLTGVLSGDDVSLTEILQGQGGAIVSLSDRTPAGTYAIAPGALTGAQAADYVLGSGSNGQLLVAPRTITYSVANGSFVYGTPGGPVVTLNGALSGDPVTGVVSMSNSAGQFVGGTFGQATSVGSYTAKVTGLSGSAAGDYVLAPTGNVDASQITITPKPLAFQVGGVTETYGDGINLGALGASALTGIVFGDLVQPVLGLTDASGDPVDITGRVAAGKYTITVTGLTGFAANNYTLGSGGNLTGLLTVNPRQLQPFLTITLPGQGARAGPVTVQYGQLNGANINEQLNLDGILSGDQVTGSVTAPTLSTSTGGWLKVGAYTFTAGATLSGAQAADYVLAPGAALTQTLTVTPMPLGYSLPNVTSTYGTAPNLSAAAVSGFASGDVVSAGAISVVGSQPISATMPAGTYVLQLSGFSGPDAGNYSVGPDLGFPSGILRVNPKPITYSIANVASTYGTLAVLPAPVLNGLVGADQVTGTIFLTPDARMNVGTYPLTLINLTGPAAANYTIASAGDTPGVLTINPKPLTYSIGGPGSAVYGDAIPNIFTLQGVLPGDDVFVDETLVNASGASFLANGLVGAGSYAATMLGAGTSRFTLFGANGSNYILPTDGRTGSITITPRPVTYVIGNMSFNYGDDHAPFVQINNLAAGDKPGFTLTATAGGVSSPLLASREPAGTYTLSLQSLGPNYSIASSGDTNGLLQVFQQIVTASMQPGETTYGTPYAITQLSGVAAGDAIGVAATINGAAGSLTSVGSGFGLPATTDVGLQNITLTGLTGAAAKNYIFQGAGETGFIKIDPKVLTWSVASATGLYGNYTPVGSFGAIGAGLTPGAATFTGLVNGDTVTPQFQLVDLNGKVTGLTDFHDVGAYFQVIQAITGAKALDYVLAKSGNSPGVLTINPMPLTITVSSGGLLYTADGKTDQLGTPGLATFTLPDGTAGPLNGDDINAVIQTIPRAESFGGAAPPLTDPLQPGDYDLKAIGITGADAHRYTVARVVDGDLQVASADLFNFGFLGLSTLGGQYAPPTLSASQSTNSLTIKTTSGTSTSTTLQNGANIFDLSTFGTFKAGAGANAQAGASVGDLKADASADATSQALMKFGVNSVTVEANASAGTAASLTVGPVNVAFGADVSADGQLEEKVKLTNVTLTANGSVTAELTQSVSAQGDLGNNVTGSAAVSSAQFATAFSDNKMVVSDDDVKVSGQEFVGVGASVTGGGSVSSDGYGVGVNASLYSPGSLALGTSYSHSYSDGELTVGVSISISIGIGGFNVSPSLTIDTKPLQDVGSMMEYAFTGGKYGGGPPPCDQACQFQNTFQGAVNLYNGDWSKQNQGMGLLSYLQANPSVLTADPTQFPFVGQLKFFWQQYGQLETNLANTQKAEQALVAKANAGTLTGADLQQAYQLRRDEEHYYSQVVTLGGQLVQQNGSLTLQSGTGN